MMFDQLAAMLHDQHHMSIMSITSANRSPAVADPEAEADPEEVPA
jgi:hypothetical protein